MRAQAMGRHSGSIPVASFTMVSLKVITCTLGVSIGSINDCTPFIRSMAQI